MFHKCDHWDYESNQKYDIKRHEKRKQESYNPNNEDQVGNDVSHEILSSYSTKINGGTNETLTSTNLSLSPQINQHDEMDGTYQPHGSDGDDNDSKEVLKKEDVAYDEHREQIKMIMSSYTDSEDS